MFWSWLFKLIRNKSANFFLNQIKNKYNFSPISQIKFWHYKHIRFYRISVKTTVQNLLLFVIFIDTVNWAEIHTYCFISFIYLFSCYFPFLIHIATNGTFIVICTNRSLIEKCFTGALFQLLNMFFSIFLINSNLKHFQMRTTF